MHISRELEDPDPLPRLEARSMTLFVFRVQGGSIHGRQRQVQHDREGAIEGG